MMQFTKQNISLNGSLSINDSDLDSLTLSGARRSNGAKMAAVASYRTGMVVSVFLA